MTDLTWTTQAEWEAAQSRNRVVSSAIGAKNAGDISLGWDNSFGVASDAVAYWTMDESSGDLVDVVGGLNMSVTGARRDERGPLGTNAVHFDGTDDYTTANSTTDPTGGGSYTIAIWVDNDPVDGIDTLVRSGSTNAGTIFLQYPSNTDIEFGFYDDGGSSVFENDFHTGTSIVNQHFIVATWDETAGELAVYLDGVADTRSKSGTKPTSPDAINFGRSLISGSPRYLNGKIGAVIMWDRALSSSEATTLTDTLTGGDLTTGTKAASGSAESIQVTCTVPEGPVGNEIVNVGAHTDTSSVSAPQGIQVEPLTDLAGLQLTIADLPLDYTRAYVADAASPSTPLESADISGFAHGDTFDLIEPLSSGGTYHVLMDANGASYTRSRYTDSNQFPHTTADFEVTAGVFSDTGSTSTSNFYNFEQVQSLVTETTAGQSTVTVHNSGGESDQVTLEAGQNSYSLSNFSNVDGDYWIAFDLGTPTDTLTPLIHDATLTVAEPTLTSVGTVPIQSTDGVHYDVPIYDITALQNEGFPIGHRARATNGNIGAFKLVATTESKLHVAVGGTIYAIAVTDQ